MVGDAGFGGILQRLFLLSVKPVIISLGPAGRPLQPAPQQGEQEQEEAPGAG